MSDITFWAAIIMAAFIWYMKRPWAGSVIVVLTIIILVKYIIGKIW